MKNNYRNTFGKGKQLDMTKLVLEVLKVAGTAALVKIANKIVEA